MTSGRSLAELTTDRWVPFRWEGGRRELQLAASPLVHVLIVLQDMEDSSHLLKTAQRVAKAIDMVT